MGLNTFVIGQSYAFVRPLTAGRVLVLIQVAALRAARQAHACGHFNLCNTEKSSTDRCEVAAEPLGEPSHFPVGANFIFIA